MVDTQPVAGGVEGHLLARLGVDRHAGNADLAAVQAIEVDQLGQHAAHRRAVVATRIAVAEGEQLAQAQVE